MVSILAISREAIIEAVKDESVLKAIAVELAKRPEILYTITEAGLGKVTTKEDLRELKNDLKMYIDARYGDLAARIDSLDKRISFLQWVFFVWLSIISLMLSVIIVMLQLS